MVRTAILLFGVFLIGIPLAGHAQSIYIKKNDSSKNLDAPGAKPKIFLTPKTSLNQPYKKKTGVQYKDKLKTAQELAHNKKQVAAYEAWKKSAKKPETIEEMIAFAQAEKAVAQGVMLQRRQKLIDYLAKKNAQKDAKLAKKAAVKSKKSLKKSSSKKSAKI